jgi:hypothetical protein
MPFSKEQILIKANATLTAIRELPVSDRAKTVSLDFANDYNRLRELALSAMPGVDELFPPASTPHSAMLHGSTAKYVEIQAYIEQIIGLLKQSDSNKS